MVDKSNLTLPQPLRKVLGALIESDHTQNGRLRHENLIIVCGVLLAHLDDASSISFAWL